MQYAGLVLTAGQAKPWLRPRPRQQFDVIRDGRYQAWSGQTGSLAHWVATSPTITLVLLNISQEGGNGENCGAGTGELCRQPGRGGGRSGSGQQAWRPSGPAEAEY